MKNYTQHLRDGGIIGREHAAGVVAALVSPDVAAEEKETFLVELRDRGEPPETIAALASALLGHAIPLDFAAGELPGPMLDVCGTGGDKLDLFNISTAAMFVLAAGGAAVVKHGNRAITSQCGGADVLEELGVRIELPPEAVKRCVAGSGCGFVFAPSFHPAFKAIGPVRKALATRGIATIFNILGPLLNPARPAHQLVGLFNPALLDTYAATLRELGRASAWVVNTAGADELLTTGPAEVRALSGQTIRAFTLDPATLGLPRAAVADLRGGSRAENAALLTGILDGSVRGPKREVVELNAAAGFVACGLAADLPAGLERARAALDSGEARRRLDALRDLSNAG